MRAAVVMLILLYLTPGCRVLMNSSDQLVYVLQAGATVGDIQKSICMMEYSNSIDLSRRLVVEGNDKITIEDIWNVQHAVGQLGAWKYVLREINGGRRVELSLPAPDGEFGTSLNVEIANGRIFHNGDEFSPEEFRSFATAAVNDTGLPLRVRLKCNAKTLGDLLDAAELLDANGLRKDMDPEMRLILIRLPVLLPGYWALVEP